MARQGNKSQVEKFKEAARELETDESEEQFDRVLGKIAKAPKKSDGEMTRWVARYRDEKGDAKHSREEHFEAKDRSAAAEEAARRMWPYEKLVDVDPE